MLKKFDHVIEELRIHARPAGLLVKKASNFQSLVTLSKGEKSIDAKKIFGIMNLGLKAKDVVTITITGADEDIAAT